MFVKRTARWHSAIAVKAKGHHHLLRALFLGGAALLVSSAAFGQSLLTNGDFTDYNDPGGGNPNVTFAGWSFTGPYRGVGVGGGAVSGNSAYFGAGYDDNGTIGDVLSQAITTNDFDQVYVLSFYVSGYGGTGETPSDSSDFYVEINGVRVFDFPNNSFGSEWVPQNFFFSTTTASTAILFGGYSPASFTVSNVSVVPEPSGFGLAAFGLSAAAVWRLRRRASAS